MSSPASIRLFTVLLLGVVLWHWWHHQSPPPPAPASRVPAGETSSKEKSLFPDE